MERKVSAPELDEWRAYYELEPWGFARGNAGIALILQRICNYLRGKDDKAIEYEGVEDAVAAYAAPRMARDDAKAAEKAKAQGVDDQMAIARLTTDVAGAINGPS